MRLQKIGKDTLYKLLFTIIVLLIIFYFIYVLFVFPFLTRYTLSLIEKKPIFFLIPKFSCAILLIIGILFFKKRNNLLWLLANMASISILLMWYSEIIYAFFTSSLEFFFLEFIAIIMLILTNRKKFIKQYDIKRDRSKLILIRNISIILVIVNQLMLHLYKNGYV